MVIVNGAFMSLYPLMLNVTSMKLPNLNASTSAIIMCSMSSTASSATYRNYSNTA